MILRKVWWMKLVLCFNVRWVLSQVLVRLQVVMVRLMVYRMGLWLVKKVMVEKLVVKLMILVLVEVWMKFMLNIWMKLKIRKLLVLGLKKLLQRLIIRLNSVLCQMLLGCGLCVFLWLKFLCRKVQMVMVSIIMMISGCIVLCGIQVISVVLSQVLSSVVVVVGSIRCQGMGMMWVKCQSEVVVLVMFDILLVLNSVGIVVCGKVESSVGIWIRLLLLIVVLIMLVKKVVGIRMNQLIVMCQEKNDLV